MTNPAIDVALRMRDSASAPTKKALRQMESDAEKLKGSLLRLAGALASAFAVGKLVAFGSESLKLAARQEAAAARVDAIVRATGGAAGVSTKQVEELAAGLQKVTTHGDEAVLEAQAILLTFRNVKGEEFARASEHALNLADALGIDAKSAAMQLGKALNDPLEGISKLTRSGITFSEEQKNTIKAMVAVGDVAGAQAVMLAELDAEVGGVARAMRDNWGGATKSLGNTWGDAREQMGYYITKSPAAVEAVQAIEEEIENFTKLLAESGVASDTMVNAAVTGLEWLLMGALWTRKAWNGLQLAFDLVAKVAVDALDSIVGAMVGLMTWANAGGLFDEQIASANQFRHDLGLLSEAIEINMQGNAQDIRDTEAAMDRLGEAADRVRRRVADAAAASRAPSGRKGLAPEGEPSDYAVTAPKVEYADPDSHVIAWQDAQAKIRALAIESALFLAALDRQRTAEERAENGRRLQDLIDAAASRRALDAQRTEEEEREGRTRWEYEARLNTARVAAEREAIDEMGAFSRQYQEERLREIEARAFYAREAGESELAVAAWVAEERRRLEWESYEAQFLAASTYYDALSARLNQWAEEHAVTVQAAADMTVDLLETAVQGTANLVARAIVYGKSLAKLGAELLKQLATQAIAAIVRMTVQYIINSFLKVQQSAAETATKVAGYAATTYASAYASAVGSMTIYGAAAYAAAAVAIMEAGAIAAYAETYGAMRGLGGVSHGGLENVPREGTYLLDRGERVIQRDQNRDLKDFLEGQKRGAGKGSTVVLQIDGREFGRAFVDLYAAGRIPMRLGGAT